MLRLRGIFQDWRSSHTAQRAHFLRGKSQYGLSDHPSPTTDIAHETYCNISSGAVFKFYTYKVPRAQVEASLLALPYIVEGYILPVADPQCDTRVAALVRLDDGVEKVDLQTIRADLSKDLPAYQLPTVLRHLRNYESVPRTWSDKTAMRKAIQKFFPQDMEERLYEEEAEVMDISAFMKAQTTKLWDLSGIR